MKNVVGFVILCSISAALLLAGTVQQIPPLPHGATAQAIQADVAGNIYVAGSLPPQNAKSNNDSSDAFVAKLAPDGSKVLYFTVLGGSSADAAVALALGTDDSAYVTGTTSSSDFPVTSTSFQTTYGGKSNQAFAAKLDPGGAVKYATYIGGNADTKGAGIAVDGAGDAFVLGSGLPSNVAPIAGGDAGALGGFVVKLDPSGSKMLTGFTGIGGEYIAIDAQGSVYLAGLGVPPTNTPFTPGAFQTTQPSMSCNGDIFFSIPCLYQYVAKVDSTGTKLIYLTGLNGAYGATPSGIAVDANGNAIVAGTTNSPDFPVTPGTYESVYAPVIPPSISFLGPFVPTVAPPATGFVAKLNATGSALVWATFFGGSASDQVRAMTVDPEGGIVLAGLASSTDLPGTEDAPQGCRPSSTQSVSFAARLAPDASSALPTQLLYGATTYVWGPNRLFGQGGPAAIASSAEGAIVELEQSGLVTAANLLAPSRLACLIDPADNAQISSVAPGQDLTIFGDVLAPTVVLGLGETLPIPNGVSATFNGAAAAVLYASPQQVNVEVPPAIGSNPQTAMTVSNSTATPPLKETRSLTVVAQQPSVFLSADGLAGNHSDCESNFNGPRALALNADGSLNSATNPAAISSTVTIFLNGVAPGVIITGVAGEREPNQSAITFTSGTPALGALPVTFQVPPSIPNGLALTQIQAGGVPMREIAVIVCVGPKPAS